MASSAPQSRPTAPRPLSPHLQIWRFTVTMAASITHRGTGVVLYGGTALLALWALALAGSYELFQAVTAFIRSPLGVIIIAGYVWSLCYHFGNGLRHLYWDSGRGLAPKTAKTTAWAVYVGATIAAGLIVFLGVSAWGN